MNPISKHSNAVERNAKTNTMIASAVFHGTLRSAIISGRALTFLF